MAPFVVPFSAYHERTKPKSWLEGLVKAYVGDGIAKDFYREMSVFVDDDTREVMARALDDAGDGDFVVARRPRRHPDRPHRPPAGWPVGPPPARRGPVARRRPWPSSATRCRRCSSGGGVDLAEVGQMFTRLTDRHSQRMARLGLSA